MDQPVTSKRRVMPEEAFEIKQLLAKYLARQPDGSYSYTDGMCDEKIAVRVNTDLTRWHIFTLRAKHFGKMCAGRPRTKAKTKTLSSSPALPSGRLYERVKQLEKRVDYIEAYLTGPDYKPEGETHQWNGNR